MRAEILRFWVTGAAYDYSDGLMWPEWKHHTLKTWLWRLALLLRVRSVKACRERGDVWPRLAVTMIGDRRAANIVAMVRHVNSSSVPGCLVDCGVWRGGSTIIMKQANDDDGAGRMVYCCDTFDGFLESDAQAEGVACLEGLKVSAREVTDNFIEHGVSMNGVAFLKGDVRDTLHHIVGPVALMRLDVDMHGPTTSCLEQLYPKLSDGGVVIIDDYHFANYECKRAVDEFRQRAGDTNQIIPIDGSGAYWIKQ